MNDDDREQPGTDERSEWERHVPEAVRADLDAGRTAEAEPEPSSQQQRPDERPEDDERARDVARLTKFVGAEAAPQLADEVAREREAARVDRIDLVTQGAGLDQADVDLLKSSGASGENVQELSRLLRTGSEDTRRTMRHLLEQERAKRR
jgi:hypothetical protein